MDFWHSVFLLIWAFFIIAYLLILFQVIGDIFSDKGLGGWAKALWLILLIAVPYLTAFVYVIVRGKGMHVRRTERAMAAKEATDQYIRQAAGTLSPAEEIEHAQALLAAGHITADEFAILKQKALA